MHTCGVILSGGKSSRMGTDKSLLTLRNKTVIEHILKELQSCSDEVIIVANKPSLYEFLDSKIVSDRYNDKGPLAGLETAFYHIDADSFMLAACDMPFANRQVYKYMQYYLEGHDAVVPFYDNQLHPLAGIYKKAVLPKIQEQLEKDELKVTSFFKQILQVWNESEVEYGVSLKPKGLW